MNSFYILTFYFLVPEALSCKLLKSVCKFLTDLRFHTLDDNFKENTMTLLKVGKFQTSNYYPCFQCVLLLQVQICARESEANTN